MKTQINDDTQCIPNHFSLKAGLRYAAYIKIIKQALRTPIYLKCVQNIQKWSRIRQLRDLIMSSRRNPVRPDRNTGLQDNKKGIVCKILLYVKYYFKIE